MSLVKIEPENKIDYRLVVIVILIFSILLSIYMLVQADLFEVNGKSYKPESPIKQYTAIVMLKPFTYTIAAHGSLKSINSQNIVNQVEGRIVQLHYRNDNMVESSTKLVQMENPHITQQHLLATQERLLAEAEALSLESELLDQRAQLVFEYSQSQGEYKLAQSELQAMTELYNQQIVSKFDFQRQGLLAENARLKTDLLQQRIESFSQASILKIKTADLKLQQAKVAEELALRDVKLLSISAEFAGVLQAFDEELKVGDWLPAGSKIATVADSRSLRAEIFINASDIMHAQIGQNVALNIKGMPGNGIVQRIAPSVDNNQVKIDVALTGELPSTALPFVEVNANITSVMKDNVLQVNKPDYLVVNNNTAKFYAKAPNSKNFEWIEAAVGLLANDKVEIISGLMPGTTIALQQPQV